MAIVFYARKSIERENSISCETQLEYCKSVIKPDERNEKVITLVDNGFSGGNINRDGFQKMMNLVRQDKVSKVIVYKLDRISRSLSDFVNILQEFKTHKVEFVSSQESFDTSSPYGVTDVSIFTGEYGAQLYGHTKHKPDNPDWSDMKLVLLTHNGIVDSDIWLKCQQKLEKNKQITNSYSNQTSWLSGKVVCEKCGHTMTTIKGKINKSGEMRRYFNCTGKTHKKICTGTKVSIYAEDLENMVYDCICEKLSDLKEAKHTTPNDHSPEVNELKLKIKAIEKSEKQLMDTMLSGGFNEDLLSLANQKATQFKNDKRALYERIDELKSMDDETDVIIDLAKSWKTADYNRKKEVAMIMIHQIIISEDGSTKIIWNKNHQGFYP